ncbi:MAG: hypothetical protein AAB614_00085 [Patescibacteria group bacterium]
MKKTIIITIIFILITIVVFSILYFSFSLKKGEDLSNVTTLNEREIQKNTLEIIKTKDFSLCENISDITYKSVCINNIAMMLAKESGDISYCQKMDGKLITTQECEIQTLSVKLSESGDATLCDKFTNQVSKDDCKNGFYLSVSQEKGDISLCKNIKNKTDSDLCINSYNTRKVFLNDPANFDCSLMIGDDAISDCKKVKDIISDFGNNVILSPDKCLQLKTSLFSTYCI